MTSTTWRLAACLALLPLAACTSGKKQDVPAPAPDRAAAEPAEVARPAESAKPAPPTAKAALGEPAPEFTLTALDGTKHSLSAYRGKTVVLEWFNPTCPYCVHAYSEGPLVKLPEELKAKGVVWLAVNSQNPKHPGSQPERNRAFVGKHGLKSPILMDPEGTVGRAYLAKTTPHCFVVDPKGVLVYAGGLDNAPNGKVDDGGERVDYVANAVADVLAGRPVSTSSSRAYG
jgi:peroxiredoxin